MEEAFIISDDDTGKTSNICDKLFTCRVKNSLIDNNDCIECFARNMNSEFKTKEECKNKNRCKTIYHTYK